MSDRSKIAWTDSTWNPLRGCRRVSPGCVNCYAEKVAARFAGEGMPYAGTVTGGRWNGTIRLVPEHLDQPLRWARPRKIFVNSMSDLFAGGRARRVHRPGVGRDAAVAAAHVPGTHEAAGAHARVSDRARPVRTRAARGGRVPLREAEADGRRDQQPGDASAALDLAWRQRRGEAGTACFVKRDSGPRSGLQGRARSFPL